MKYEYNNKYYFDGKLHQLMPKMTAIHTFVISDGTLIAMFQGNRGRHPDLDFRVKILKTGKDARPKLPPHLYWIVDLMIKAQFYPTEVREIINFYIDFYNNCKPFDSVEERASYKPTTVKYIYEKYKHVSCKNTLPIDYTAYVMELFSYCEKRNEGAKMFLGLLVAFRQYIDGELDYMDVLNARVLPRF